MPAAARPLLVIGGIALDITATVGKTAGNSILHTSTPGKVKHSLGGVGRNVAEAAWRTGGNDVKLVSVVGDDLAGESLRQGMKSIGMTTTHISILKNQSTAVYNALHNNDGQLIAAVADMNIFDSMDESTVANVIRSESPSFVCFDGNITPRMMKTIAKACQSLSIPVLFEPTSVPKSLKLFEYVETVQSKSIKYISPNQFELEAMYEKIQANDKLRLSHYKASQNTLKNAPRLANAVLSRAIYLSNYVPNVITKLGEEGCLYVGNSIVEYFPPESIDPAEIKSVTGAGDCFVGTLIANLQRYQGINFTQDILHSIIHKSQISSIRTLKSNHAVSEQISNDLLAIK